MKETLHLVNGLTKKNDLISIRPTEMSFLYSITQNFPHTCSTFETRSHQLRGSFQRMGRIHRLG